MCFIQLRRTWADDQPFRGRLQRRDDLVQERVVLRCSLPGEAAGLVVKVRVGFRRRNIHFDGLVAIEKQHSCFAMIDPDNGVIGLHDALLLVSVDPGCSRVLRLISSGMTAKASRLTP